jgi:ATP adenylyltransferase
MAQAPRLVPGSLAAAIAARAESALRAGALLPIPTRVHVIEDAGIAFVVRVLAALARKREAAAAGGGRNPFLPFDPELFVADLSDTHVCLLNKFNAEDRHVLLVTRRFQDQEEPLDRADFAALWTSLGETGGLGFYNSGEAAGASQRHKHLQLVPLPLGPGPAFPLAPHLEAAAAGAGVVAPSALPFPAALARLDALAAHAPDEAAGALEALYRELLRRTGVEPGRTPYNLLATRRLLWLVPRSRAEWQGIPVNALGYAGALLVPDAAALARLRAVGPLACLRAVAAAPAV